MIHKADLYCGQGLYIYGSVWEEQNSLFSVPCSGRTWSQVSESAGKAPRPWDDKLCSALPLKNDGLGVKDA